MLETWSYLSCALGNLNFSFNGQCEIPAEVHFFQVKSPFILAPLLTFKTSPKSWNIQVSPADFIGVRWSILIPRLPSRELTYSSLKVAGKMICLFHRWDMLAPGRVILMNVTSQDNLQLHPETSQLSFSYNTSKAFGRWLEMVILLNPQKGKL